MADFNSFLIAISGALFGFGASPKPVTMERAFATLYVDGGGRLIKPPMRLVLTGDDADRLASYFPSLGVSRPGSKPSGWRYAADVLFERTDGTESWVRIGYGYGVWTEGSGDRSVRPGAWEFLKRRAM
ncbi:MAG: hypothetical protein KIS66_17165 [Fimbriimonadaceae bacterium]|nr:hypothetical protein [Fimbriimonadaceae bacterium]